MMPLTPSDFVLFHARRIVKLSALDLLWKREFPLLPSWREFLPDRIDGEVPKIKCIEGLGSFLYLSSRGKMQFHEFVLDYVCLGLRMRGIGWKRPARKRGADLVVRGYNIELEIVASASHNPQDREDLVRRVLSAPDATIFLFLNRLDKMLYLDSRLREIVFKNQRFLTIDEFFTRVRSL